MTQQTTAKEQLKQNFESTFDDVDQREHAARALTTQQDAALLTWGDRETVIATGIRIKTMLPGGDKLSVPQALAAGQYVVATGLNPFRGEVYFYPDKKGNLSIVDGYKALTRWAGDECPYDVQYRPLETGKGEVHRVKCIIMRHDRQEQLDYYLGKGADFQTAFGLVTTSAVGVVQEKETRWPNGDPKDPPQGWTWEQRAETRALKNALNRSHGMPTVAQLARQSWIVNGTTTEPEDWEGTETLNGAEAERLAEMRASHREYRTKLDAMEPEEREAEHAKNRRALWGDPDFEGFDTDPAPEPDNGDIKPADTLDETPTVNSPGSLWEAIKPLEYYKGKPHMLNTLNKVNGTKYKTWPVANPPFYTDALETLTNYAAEQEALKAQEVVKATAEQMEL